MEILFEFFFQIFFLGVCDRSGGNSLHYKPTRFSCVTKTAPKARGPPSPPHPQPPGLQAPRDPTTPSSSPLGHVTHWQRGKPALQGWRPWSRDSWALKCDQLRSKGRRGALQPEHQVTQERQARRAGAARWGCPAAEKDFSQAAPETWAFTLHNMETGTGRPSDNAKGWGEGGVGLQEAVPQACLHCSGSARAGAAHPPPTSYRRAASGEDWLPPATSSRIPPIGTDVRPAIPLVYTTQTICLMRQRWLCLDSGSEHSPPAKIIGCLTSVLYQQMIRKDRPEEGGPPAVSHAFIWQSFFQWNTYHGKDLAVSSFIWGGVVVFYFFSPSLEITILLLLLFKKNLLQYQLV